MVATSRGNAGLLLGDTFLCEPPKSLVLKDGFHFRHGGVIAPFTIVYETFGVLNRDRSNAILVCHALSPGAHCAGKYTAADRKAGWWDGMVGYGKGIDLDRYFVVCVNFPGSPWGTTAPQSIDPATGKPYGSRYPAVTVEDMVEAERIVADHLRIDRFAAIAGSSLGGLQALMWGARHPARVASIICMAAAAAVPAASVAWHLIGRKMIESDPEFRGGDYYDNPNPLRGLQMARMIGHMTYRSDESLSHKFGRRRRGGSRQFEVDSYLEYKAQQFAGSYDANSYIRVMSAMDEMDLEEQFGSLDAAFADFRGKALLMSFDSDWLFPSRELARVQDAMASTGIAARHVVISTPNGHDAFLVDYDLITPEVRAFLGSAPRRST
jgi:homoserine O-acetyltransferase/O-succinyltransferase